MLSLGYDDIFLKKQFPKDNEIAEMYTFLL